MTRRYDSGVVTCIRLHLAAILWLVYSAFPVSMYAKGVQYNCCPSDSSASQPASWIMADISQNASHAWLHSQDKFMLRACELVSALLVLHSAVWWEVQACGLGADGEVPF